MIYQSAVRHRLDRTACENNPAHTVHNTPPLMEKNPTLRDEIVTDIQKERQAVHRNWRRHGSHGQEQHISDEIRYETKLSIHCVARRVPTPV